MKKWIIFLLPVILCHAKPKIYDCFTFFNELDVLEIRLSEMYEHVDRFVLVESDETFQGNSKPLHYLENRERFEKYNDKIIHVIVHDRIPGNNLHWEREYFQRNQIMRGLKKCKDDDIVIVSDVDEIIRGSDIERWIKPIKKGRDKAMTAGLRIYAFYLNRRRLNVSYFIGSVATTFKYLKKKTPQKIRDGRHWFPLCENVGWHFTNMGGLASYRYKLSSFAHPEKNIPEETNSSNLYERIQTLFSLEEIDSSFPQFIQQNIDEYLRMGLLDFEGNPAYR